MQLQRSTTALDSYALFLLQEQSMREALVFCAICSVKGCLTPRISSLPGTIHTSLAQQLHADQVRV